MNEAERQGNKAAGIQSSKGCGCRGAQSHGDPGVRIRRVGLGKDLTF